MSPATRLAFGAAMRPVLLTPGLTTTRALGIAAGAVPTKIFPPASPTNTLLPDASVTLPFCEVMTPSLLTCAPYRPTSVTAVMRPRFSTSPERLVKLILPARKSESEMWPAPAMIPPTFTTAPLPKKMPYGFAMTIFPLDVSVPKICDGFGAVTRFSVSERVLGWMKFTRSAPPMLKLW